MVRVCAYACTILVNVWCVEVAMGTKTGESRSLVDMVEKEWTMKLPDPAPLSTLGVYLQVCIVAMVCSTFYLSI